MNNFQLCALINETLSGLTFLHHDHIHMICQCIRNIGDLGISDQAILIIFFNNLWKCGYKRVLG